MQIYNSQFQTIDKVNKKYCGKQLLRLGKCESRHFETKIAATTLCFLQYNMLSLVKRFDGYESLGALFRQANAETLELTVKERIVIELVEIWLIIKEILTILANYCEIDIEFVTKHILSDNKQLANILNLNILAKAA